MRVVLTGDEFAKLVRGNSVMLRIDTIPISTADHIRIEITLGDIGFAVMKHYISEAEKES